MILACHTLIYSDDASATRAFFRDVLGFPSVDAGTGVDDLESSMAELKAKGAEFSSGPDDYGYGIVAMVKVPGADDVQLYQPRHVTAYATEASG